MKIWAAVVLAAGLVTVLTTFSDYGITWDEPVQSHYGEGVLRWPCVLEGSRYVSCCSRPGSAGACSEQVAAAAEPSRR